MQFITACPGAMKMKARVINMSNKWEFLTGDCNYKEYGGKWYKEVNNRCYHVIELINMHEATGEENQPKYAV